MIDVAFGQLKRQKSLEGIFKAVELECHNLKQRRRSTDGSDGFRNLPTKARKRVSYIYLSVDKTSMIKPMLLAKRMCH
jgi:hypothetical protein